MNIFTCPKCGLLYNAGVSLAIRHTCRERPTGSSQQSAAAWRYSMGWREGQGFAGARRRSRDDQRDRRISAAWAVLSGLGTAASMLSGIRVRRRTNWIKAAQQPQAGGFVASGDGGSSGS